MWFFFFFRFWHVVCYPQEQILRCALYSLLTLFFSFFFWPIWFFVACLVYWHVEQRRRVLPFFVLLLFNHTMVHETEECIMFSIHGGIAGVFHPPSHHLPRFHFFFFCRKLSLFTTINYCSSNLSYFTSTRNIIVATYTYYMIFDFHTMSDIGSTTSSGWEDMYTPQLAIN